LLGILAASAAAQKRNVRQYPPPNYTGDGCTFFLDCNYRDCCFEHDKDYFRGGTAKERLASDKRLYRCVRSKNRWYNKITAPIMFAGVRLFGVPWLPTSFRWGFGSKSQKRASLKNSRQRKRNPQRND